VVETVVTEVGEVRLAALTAGDASNGCVVLLHGWPQSGHAFHGVVDELGADQYVLAFDLPGIGGSRGAPPNAEKSTLADLILRGAEQLGGRDIIVAGYDVGGMISFAAARDHGARIAGAMVMNTVIPGIPPWDDILGDPRIFHFALHALPELPELLVTGRERAYFDFFYDIMSGDSAALSDDARAVYAEAYSRPEALTCGFDWYRAMPDDARRNAEPRPIETPMRYVRGDADGRSPDDYLPHFRAAGATSITGTVIPGGEYVAEEQPARLIEAIRDFRTTLG
jgi:pimeloyl-ACP methyl ester carboxylesterase